MSGHNLWYNVPDTIQLTGSHVFTNAEGLEEKEEKKKQKKSGREQLKEEAKLYKKCIDSLVGDADET